MTAGTFLQAVSAAGELDEGFRLLDRVPPSLLCDSFPIHNSLREACRVARDEAGAARVSALIDERGLTNLSPEAVVVVGGEETRHFPEPSLNLP